MCLTCNDSTALIEFSKKNCCFNLYKTEVESFIQFQVFDYVFKNKFNLRDLEKSGKFQLKVRKFFSA